MYNKEAEAKAYVRKYLMAHEGIVYYRDGGYKISAFCCTTPTGEVWMLRKMSVTGEKLRKSKFVFGVLSRYEDSMPLYAAEWETPKYKGIMVQVYLSYNNQVRLYYGGEK